MALLRVLVVDDDQEFRAWVKRALADVASVVEAATPAEALWTLERDHIDILLCDFRLATSTSGLDVLAAAKELWPGLGRILVTGYGSELDAVVPAHAVIAKPCDVGALRELLRLVPLFVDVIRADDVN